MTETRTAARMKRLVAQWRKSGESAASFARRHQIAPWTFWYWTRKLSTQPVVGPAPAPGFVPVRVAGDDAGPVIEIVLTGGERIQIRGTASADVVRAAVSALRSTC
jgi:transposase-like protein